MSEKLGKWKIDKARWIMVGLRDFVWSLAIPALLLNILHDLNSEIDLVTGLALIIVFWIVRLVRLLLDPPKSQEVIS